MGLSTKKTTQSATQNQNTSATTTPTNPEWVTTGTQALGDKIKNVFAGFDPSRLAPGADPLQTQAAGAAASLGGFSGYGGLGGAEPQRPVGSNKGMQVLPQPVSEQGFMPNGGQGAAAPQGGADPYADAMNTFARLSGSGANTYAPTTAGASGYDAATRGAATRGAATRDAATGDAASLLSNLDSYMSPYRNDVVDAALADFDYGANKDLAQNKLDQERNKAWGGSGSALERAFMTDDIRRGRGTLSAGLNDQMFNTGAALSGQDADRRQGMTIANMGALNTAGSENMGALNAAGSENMNAWNLAGSENTGALNAAGQFNTGARNTQTLANQAALNTGGQFNAGQRDAALTRQAQGAGGLVDTANSQQTQQRANIDMQSQLGEILRQIQTQQGAAPIAALGMESDLWNSLPFDLFKGSNSTGTLSGTSTSKTKESGASLSDWLSYMAANAQAAATAGAGSDARIKRDVETIEHDADGVRWVWYNYLWDEPDAPRRRGVIAQEVREIFPDVVSVHPMGFLTVDYAKLEG